MTQAETIARAQELIGYQFNDRDLLVTALTHASVADSRVVSNERLEFLGDAILGVIICDALYRRFPEYLEGELTKLKSLVVSRKTCAIVADQLGLTPLLILGKGLNHHSKVPPSLRAAVIESAVGAIYLDGGLAPAREFVMSQFGDFIEQADRSTHQGNHKSLLQHYAQKVLSLTPQYDQLDEQGPDHSKCFEVCVTLGNRRFPSAWAASKKEAEQLAAKRALLIVHPEAYAGDEAEPFEFGSPAAPADAGA
ncbi:MAG: ribonuclease III [Phycisphaerales bacterium]|nr:ribonuclease III [Phycisphaerales bacterium]